MRCTPRAAPTTGKRPVRSTCTARIRVSTSPRRPSRPSHPTRSPSTPARRPGCRSRWRAPASSAQRSPAPHASEAREELDEVHARGAAVGSTRSAEETVTALWYIEQAQPALNRIARQAAIDTGIDLADSARLFALLNIAMADGVLSVFEAKYVDNSGGRSPRSGAPTPTATPTPPPDPVWQPFLTTPRHPEYPSAHGVVQGAGVQVLNAVFGRHYSFSTTSGAPGVEGIVRSYGDFDEFAALGESARILGGLHFRTAVEEGAQQGKKVGKWVLEHYLLPVQ